MKKIYDLAVLAVYALALVGGTGYLFFDHHALFGAAVLALGAMAFPYVKDRFKELIG